MITVFSQEEVMKDLIASERREAREESWEEDARKFAKNMHNKLNLPISMIAEALDADEKTVREWLGLPDQP